MSTSETDDVPHSLREQALVDFAVAQSSAIFCIVEIEATEDAVKQGAPLRFVSDNVTSITGHKPVDFTTDRLYGRGLIHPDDLGAYQDKVASRLDIGQFHQTYRYKTASNEGLWFRDEVRLLPREEGSSPRELAHPDVWEGGADMGRKRYKPEEIAGLLRQADVLHSQGMTMSDAIRQIGVSEVTFYRWRKEYGGLNGDQLRRLKELEKENERLCRAVAVERLAWIVSTLLVATIVITEEGLVSLANSSARRLFSDHAPDPGISIFAATQRDSLTSALQRTGPGWAAIKAEILTIDGRTLTAGLCLFEAYGGHILVFEGVSEADGEALPYDLALHNRLPTLVPVRGSLCASAATHDGCGTAEVQTTAVIVRHAENRGGAYRPQADRVVSPGSRCRGNGLATWYRSDRHPGHSDGHRRTRADGRG